MIDHNDARARAELAELAEHAAAAAGTQLSAVWRPAQRMQVDVKEHHEPVTRWDLEADDVIRKILGEHAAYDVVSEEAWSGWRQGMFDGPVWIVDPLDGTANFARGNPYFSVSVALAVDGEVIAGSVHAPALDQTFRASLGSGATLNGQEISTSATGRLHEAIVSTGLPHDRSKREEASQRIQLLAASCGDVRRMGSPALDICSVGAGVLDAHVESLAPWDLAAGVLVALEAGCRRGNIQADQVPIPRDLAGAELVVSAPGIFDDLVRLLGGVA